MLAWLLAACVSGTSEPPDVEAELPSDIATDAASDAGPPDADANVDAPPPDAVPDGQPDAEPELPSDVAPDAETEVSCVVANCPPPSDGCMEAACVEGACAEVAKSCNDNNACTLDYCAAGTCQNEPRNTWFSESTPGYSVIPKVLLDGSTVYVAKPLYDSVSGSADVTLRSRKDISASVEVNWDVNLGVSKPQNKILAMARVDDAIVVVGSSFNEVWVRSVSTGGVLSTVTKDISLAAGTLVRAGAIDTGLSDVFVAADNGQSITAVSFPLTGSGADFKFEHDWSASAEVTSVVVHETQVVIADTGPALRRISVTGVPDAVDSYPVAVTGGLVGRIEHLLSLEDAQTGLLAVGYAKEPGDTGGDFPNTGQGWLVRFTDDLGVVTNVFTTPPQPNLSVKLLGASLMGSADELLVAIAGAADEVEGPGANAVVAEDPLFAIADLYGRVRHQRLVGADATKRQLFETIATHPEEGFIVAGADGYGADGKTAVHRIGPWGSLSCEASDPCAEPYACASDSEPCTQESCDPTTGCATLLVGTGDSCGLLGQTCDFGECLD